MVTVAYDTGARQDATGAALALWLELARALYARHHDHDVQFVALGAENTALNEGSLGSRRLVEFLRDDGLSPLVISLDGVSGGAGAFAARGDDAGDLVAVADELGVATGAPGPARPSEAVFERAGMRQVSVTGGADDVGRVLLEFLAGEAGAPSPS